MIETIAASVNSQTDFALSVKGLRVEAPSGAAIVDAVSFDLAQGEILGIVGESGSGKTTCALASLGMTHPGAKLTTGTLTAKGRTFDLTDANAIAPLRGRFMSYVPQSPGTALNPAMRIGMSLREMLLRRDDHDDQSTWNQTIVTTMDKVNLPGTPEFLRRFPHQLSGGQQQRVCIAMALLSGAEVVFLDEPTTGLDVVTQQSVISELKRLRQDLGLSMIYISHDLAVVSQLVDRVTVMYAGSIVELGRIDKVLRTPAHPYTRGLLASTLNFRQPADVQPIPGSLTRSSKPLTHCAFALRCSHVQKDCQNQVPELLAHAERMVRCFHPVDGALEILPSMKSSRAGKSAIQPVLAVEGLRIEYGSGSAIVAAVHDVSFRIEAGKCLALLGESGSGKSTIARSVVGLKPAASGSMQLNGSILASSASERTDDQRRRLQMVFQNSSAALNPRENVQTAITRGLAIRRDGGSARTASVDELLKLVRLPVSVQQRLPRELSGGERQRVCIARALATSPDVIVCDEITSALDVSVQASVLKLLKELQLELGLSLLFITHDMGVVSYLADSVIILDRGRVCESGATKLVLNAPKSEYAQRLMAAVPTLSSFQNHHLG